MFEKAIAEAFHLGNTKILRHALFVFIIDGTETRDLTCTDTGTIINHDDHSFVSDGISSIEFRGNMGLFASIIEGDREFFELNVISVGTEEFSWIVANVSNGNDICRSHTDKEALRLCDAQFSTSTQDAGISGGNEVPVTGSHVDVKNTEAAPHLSKWVWWGLFGLVMIIFIAVMIYYTCLYGRVSVQSQLHVPPTKLNGAPNTVQLAPIQPGYDDAWLSN